MSHVAMFAGQGAQKPGMGKRLYDESILVRKLFDEAAAELHIDLASIIFNGSQEELTRSDVCQPAIFTVSFASWLVFKERFPQARFVCAGGLSLGEWGALCAAEVVTFSQTLKILQARGRFMQDACEAVPSAMVAVVGASPSQIEELEGLTGCTVANVNSPQQIVLSGSKEEIALAVQKAKELGIKRAIRLETAGAFHSKFMQRARDRLQEVLEGMEFMPPKMPVLSNVTGRGHPQDPGAIRELMLRQVTEKTNWAADVETARALGGKVFVEFGPGKVLGGLVKKIDPALETANAEDLIFG